MFHQFLRNLDFPLKETALTSETCTAPFASLQYNIYMQNYKYMVSLLIIQSFFNLFLKPPL